MHPETAPHPSLTPTWLGDLAQSAPCEPDWLWYGFLARGAVTLLSSQWKMGKTTLLAILLNRLRQGQPLADLSVSSGKAVVVSEEDVSLWAARARQHDLGNHVCVLSRPFLAKPNAAQWLELLNHILELHRQFGLSLAVFDTLAAFLPGYAESLPALALEYLSPLHRLTGAGLAVLLVHHTRKGTPAAGQAARGTGALSGFADVLMELHWHTTADDTDRRRRLDKTASCDWGVGNPVQQTTYANSLGITVTEAASLNVKSRTLIATPIEVNGERWGVLVLDCQKNVSIAASGNSTQRRILSLSAVMISGILKEANL